MKFITRKVSECCHFVTYNKNGVDYCGACGKPTHIITIEIKQNLWWYIRKFFSDIYFYIRTIRFDLDMPWLFYRCEHLDYDDLEKIADKISKRYAN
jgi:hypothetical protein